MAHSRLETTISCAHFASVGVVLSLVAVKSNLAVLGVNRNYIDPGVDSCCPPCPRLPFDSWTRSEVDCKEGQGPSHSSLALPVAFAGPASYNHAPSVDHGSTNPR